MDFPHLLDSYAKNKCLREKRKMLLFSRCIEKEHLEVLNRFIGEYSLSFSLSRGST